MENRTQTRDIQRLETSVLERRVKVCETYNKWCLHLLAWWRKCDDLACFGKGGDMLTAEGIWNQEDYHLILQHHVMNCGRRLTGANFILQQENEPKLQTMKNYLEKEQSAGFVSSRSPNLNPVELLWSTLTVWYLRSAHQASTTCVRGYRKLGGTFPQITSTNWQLEDKVLRGCNCCRWNKIIIPSKNHSFSPQWIVFSSENSSDGLKCEFSWKTWFLGG